MNVDVLHIADACTCSVTKAPSKARHSSAGLGVFAASTFQKSETIKSYCTLLVYHDLSSREYTKSVYGNGVLKVDIARLPKFALQAQVQGRRF